MTCTRIVQLGGSGIHCHILNVILQELMDKYDNDLDGRLSLDEYLGEFSSIYLHYLRLCSILIAIHVRVRSCISLSKLAFNFCKVKRNQFHTNLRIKYGLSYKPDALSALFYLLFDVNCSYLPF